MEGRKLISRPPRENLSSDEMIKRSRDTALQMQQQYRNTQQYKDDTRAMTWQERREFSGADVRADPRFQTMSPEEWRASRSFMDEFKDGFYQGIGIGDAGFNELSKFLGTGEWRPLNQMANAGANVIQKIGEGDIVGALSTAKDLPSTFMPENKVLRTIVDATTGNVEGAIANAGLTEVKDLIMKNIK
jgi:hypothetical protein